MLDNEDLTKIKTLIQAETKPIKKTLDLVVKLFDRDYVALRKRVEKIEDHLDIPSPN